MRTKMTIQDEPGGPDIPLRDWLKKEIRIAVKEIEDKPDCEICTKTRCTDCVLFKKKVKDDLRYYIQSVQHQKLDDNHGVVTYEIKAGYTKSLDNYNEFKIGDGVDVRKVI